MISLADLLTEISGLHVRMRRAATSTLLVHGVNALCAAGFVLPLAASVPEQSLAEQPAVGALVTVIRLFDSLTGSPLRFGALPALVLLSVTPFLQVLWLRAQLTAAALHEHARHAAQAYKSACAVYFASLAYAALLLVIGLGLAHGFELLLRPTHNLRLQQTTGLLLAAPWVLAALLHAPCLLDRAQLALARGDKLNLALLWEVIRSVDFRVCRVRAAFTALTLCLVLLSLAPRLWLGTSATTGAWLFVLAQLTAAARTLARCAWLAWLAEHSEAPVAQAAAESGGELSPQGMS
jgi:hypothetical protein